MELFIKELQKGRKSKKIPFYVLEKPEHTDNRAGYVTQKHDNFAHGERSPVFPFSKIGQF